MMRVGPRRGGGGRMRLGCGTSRRAGAPSWSVARAALSAAPTAAAATPRRTNPQQSPAACGCGGCRRPSQRDGARRGPCAAPRRRRAPSRPRSPHRSSSGSAARGRSGWRAAWTSRRCATPGRRRRPCGGRGWLTAGGPRRDGRCGGGRPGGPSRRVRRPGRGRAAALGGEKGWGRMWTAVLASVHDAGGFAGHHVQAGWG